MERKLKNILLVEPNFPYPAKSKNKANNIHKNFLPISLLKFGAFYKSKGYNVKLVRGEKESSDIGFIPDKILITSLFTYWSRYVWDSVDHYREQFPDSEIILGGIYVTLHHGTAKFKANAKKYRVKYKTGLSDKAEKYLPDYSLIEGPVDYHLTHTMRGCFRRCTFCGTWKLEPTIQEKNEQVLIDELTKIGKNKVIFFDNNFLRNQYIKPILKELANLKINNKAVTCESQSGFDGRLLEKDPELAVLLKNARFTNIKIAWDHGIDDALSIKRQIEILNNAGFKSKDISVFMIYNYEIPFEEMIAKLNFCKKIGVQINDCRYRPLEATHDDYNPMKKDQNECDDYYIHKIGGWTDIKVKAFRKRVREHNIWIRYAKDKGQYYNHDMEKWSAIHNTYRFFKISDVPKIDEIRLNEALMERIKLMNRLKNFIKKNNLTTPDFSKIEENSIDEKLKKLEQVIYQKL